MKYRALTANVTCLWRKFVMPIAVYAAVICGASRAEAHGELLLRIAAVTRQIESGTNVSADLFVQRGELYRQDANWDLAEGDFRAALEHGANEAVVESCRARLLADAGKLESARAKFDKVLSDQPENIDALIGRARVLARLHQNKSAMVDYQKALAVTKAPEMEYFLELAEIQRAEGMVQEALKTLDNGIGKFGPVLPLQEPAQELDLISGNTESALIRLDEILKLAPRTEEWWTRRGEILLNAQRLSEARGSFRSALRAIDLLPKRIREGAAIHELQKRIQSGMAQIPMTSVASHD